MDPTREQHRHFRPATIQEDAEQLRVELEGALEPEPMQQQGGRARLLS